MTVEQIMTLVFDILNSVIQKLYQDIPGLAKNSTFNIITVIIGSIASKNSQGKIGDKK